LGSFKLLIVKCTENISALALLLQIRASGLSQLDIASYVGVSRDAISKYERDDIIPFVENANKIDKVLGVSVDYLISEDDNLEIVDIDMLNRMKEIQRLSEDDKTTVVKIIDAFIRDTKTKKAYA
jgi:transcriptional regulator with XRE-family HTH domain